MKHILKFRLLILLALLPWNRSFGDVFNTSKSFDLLCTPQYIDQITEDARFAELCSDSVFISNIADVNSNCSASKLCNLYSELKGDKNDISQCLFIIQHLDSLARNIEWASGILSVQPQLVYATLRLCRYVLRQVPQCAAEPIP